VSVRKNFERRDRVAPVILFFAFPEAVRKIVYTTNAMESLHMSLRKIIKTRGSSPTEESAFKLLYLALVRVIEKWETVQHWKQMLTWAPCEVTASRPWAVCGKSQTTQSPSAG
jgi:transposase-like protein